MTDKNTEQLTPEVPKKRGGSTSLLLLLLLLLVGAAGAGFYFFGQDILVSDTPVAAAKPQKLSKMKVPARPKAARMPDAVKEEVVAEEKVAAVAPASAVFRQQKGKTADLSKVKPAPIPVFALSSGSYLYSGELSKAIAQIEKMGYEVSVSQKSESHEMTRLLVGRYDKPMAQNRLAEVKKIAKGSFLVAEDGKYAVYAGSFLSLDKARRAADLLYREGVRVDELQIRVDLPRTTIRFGGFVARDEAQKIARKLKKRGVMDPQIVSIK